MFASRDEQMKREEQSIKRRGSLDLGIYLLMMEGGQGRARYNWFWEINSRIDIN